MNSNEFYKGNISIQNNKTENANERWPISRISEGSSQTANKPRFVDTGIAYSGGIGTYNKKSRLQSRISQIFRAKCPDLMSSANRSNLFYIYTQKKKKGYSLENFVFDAKKRHFFMANAENICGKYFSCLAQIFMIFGANTKNILAKYH